MKNNQARDFFVITFILLSFTACTKDEYQNSQPDLTSFPFGSTAGMDLTIWDTTVIGGYHDYRFFDLDVTGDQVADVRFSSEVWGSPGIGQHPRSAIASLSSNFELRGELLSDTTFLHRVVVYDNNDPNQVYAYSNDYYYCTRYAADDSIVSTRSNQFHLLNFRKGDSFNVSDYFQPDSLILCQDSYSYPATSIVTPDTTFVTYIYSNLNCDDFPSDVIRYIGFRFYDGTSYRLGWIKLIVGNKLKVTVVESAIEN